MARQVKTPISGLVVRLNKVVKDERGFLCEMAPSGTKDGFLGGPIGNIYASIANGRGVARAGHYHHRNVEHFFTLSGTALWLFFDWREASPTRRRSFAMVTGYDKFEPKSKVKVTAYTIDSSEFAETKVPPGVYHVYFPLTSRPVTVVAIASEAYDATDYVYPKLSDMPELSETLKAFGLGRKD